MVQPVATSPSCIPSYNPCELISGLVQRIASCVASIFTAIGEFVKSFFRSPAAAPPVVSVPPVVSIPTAVVVPAPAVVSTPTAVSASAVVSDLFQGGKAFLTDQIDRFKREEPDFDLAQWIDHSPEAACIFFTCLLLDNLVLLGREDLGPLPYFLTGSAGTSGSYIATIASLRQSFENLSSENRPLVRDAFLGILTGNAWIDHHSTRPEDAFLSRLTNFADLFASEAPRFIGCVNAWRNEYLASERVNPPSPSTAPLAASRQMDDLKIEADKTLLRAQIKRFTDTTLLIDLEGTMETVQSTRNFMAHLILSELICERDLNPSLIPYFMYQPCHGISGATPLFFDEIVDLRSNYKRLPSEIDTRMVKAHIRRGLRFDRNEAAAVGILNFMERAIHLVDELALNNPHFAACSDAIRAEYLQEKNDAETSGSDESSSDIEEGSGDTE
ncbi:MAG TPA: hypothetical protein VIJ46_04590 [Rhabdochlamydiaceae bacterium]